MRLLTIGHSTLPIEIFLQALKDNGSTLLVDVRRFPGSRRHPQFSQAALFCSVREAGMRAEWREGLGGRRAPAKDSINTAWRSESFRGYADYMQTPAFAAEIDWLMQQDDGATVMCAEAVPWRCHRQLISDAVLARGGSVEHILVAANGKSSRQPHELTEFARVAGGRVWYPASEQRAQAELFG
jgi:uncharacterized protein (DUF488 family)